MEFEPNDLGLLVPAARRRRDPRMANFKTYLTYRDFTGHSMSEARLVALLRRLSASDCLASLAHIDGRLYASTDDEAVQRTLVTELSGDSEPGRLLLEKLRDPR